MLHSIEFELIELDPYLFSLLGVRLESKEILEILESKDPLDREEGEDLW